MASTTCCITARYKDADENLGLEPEVSLLIPNDAPAFLNEGEGFWESLPQDPNNNAEFIDLSPAIGDEFPENTFALQPSNSVDDFTWQVSNSLIASTDGDPFVDLNEEGPSENLFANEPTSSIEGSTWSLSTPLIASTEGEPFAFSTSTTDWNEGGFSDNLFVNEPSSSIDDFTWSTNDQLIANIEDDPLTSFMHAMDFNEGHSLLFSGNEVPSEGNLEWFSH